MSDELKKMIIRLKPELLERIQATARQLGMSMNSFVVQTLENIEMYPAESRFKELERKVKALEERVENLEKN